MNNIRPTGSPEYCLYSDNDVCKSSDNDDLKEGGGSEKKSQYTREEIPKSRGMISTVLGPPKREQKSRQSISEHRLIQNGEQVV